MFARTNQFNLARLKEIFVKSKELIPPTKLSKKFKNTHLDESKLRFITKQKNGISITLTRETTRGKNLKASTPKPGRDWYPNDVRISIPSGLFS